MAHPLKTTHKLRTARHSIRLTLSVASRTSTSSANSLTLDAQLAQQFMALLREMLKSGTYERRVTRSGSAVVVIETWPREWQ
jgi:hypothetical protein